MAILPHPLSLQNLGLRFREKSGGALLPRAKRLGRMLFHQPAESLQQGFLKVMLGATYRCQCSCEYCCTNSPQKLPNELTTKEFIALLDDIGQLPSLGTLVAFFGGEALLRPDIFTLIQHASAIGLFVEIESNGILLTADNVQKLKKAGLHHVFVKLESTNPKRHDELTRLKGCHAKAVAGMRRCVEAGLSVSASAIAFKEHLFDGELRRVIEFARSEGVTSVRILHPTAAGKWLHAEDKLLNDEEKQLVGKHIEPGFVYLESSYSSHGKIGRICPTVQKKFLYISPTGDIQPCPFVPISIGNIRTAPLHRQLPELWSNKAIAESTCDDCVMNKLEQRERYLPKITVAP